jgi:hypothetical protein
MLRHPRPDNVIISVISVDDPSLPLRVPSGQSMILSSTKFIPTDIFYVVCGHLADRRDLYAATLTSRDFNRAATPLLYRTLDTDTPDRLWGHKSVRLFLDSRIAPEPPGQTGGVIHPAYSLLRRPELACHVRHVRETGRVPFPFLDSSERWPDGLSVA